MPTAPGIGPMELILLIFLTGNTLGIPVGIPPGPEDPLILRMAPSECLLLTSWASLDTANETSANATEKMLAEPEVRKFMASATKRLYGSFLQSLGKDAEKNRPQIDLALKNLRQLLSKSGMAYVSDVTIKKSGTSDVIFGAAISLGDASADLRTFLEKLKESSSGQVTTVEVGGNTFYRAQPDPKGPELAWGVRGKYLLLASGATELEKLMQRARGEAPAWLTALRAEVAVPKVATFTYVNTPKLLQLVEATEATTSRPGAPQQTGKVIQAFGLDRVGVIASVTGLDKKGAISRTVVKINGTPTGILSAIDAQPLVAADLKPISQGSPLAMAFKFDASKFFPQLMVSMNQIDPMSGEQMEAGLSQAINGPLMAARRNQITGNAKQILLAFHNYHDAHNAFPSAYSIDAKGKPLLSWRVHILPFLGEDELYDKFHFNEPWDSEHNKSLIPLMPDVFQAPGSDVAEGKTNYLGVRGKDAVLIPPKESNEKGPIGATFATITDGTSNTVMLVEAKDEAAVTWTKPDDFDSDAKDPIKTLVGLRANGFVAGFADGAVKVLPADLPAKTLSQLFSKSDGELVDLPDSHDGAAPAYDVQKDVLASLGDTWRIYANADAGGLLTGWTISAPVTNREKLEPLYQELLDMALEPLGGISDEPQPGMPSVTQKEVGDVTIYTFHPPFPGIPVTPSWCLTNKELLIGSTLVAVEQAMKGDTTESIASQSELAPFLNNGKKLLAITYLDTRQLTETVLPLLQGFLNQAKQGGIPGVPALPFGDDQSVPTADVIKHLQPTISALFRTDAGIEWVTTQTMPVANPAITNATMVATLLPAVSKARAAARRVQSMNNMKQMMLSFHNHADIWQGLPVSHTVDQQGKPLLSWRVLMLPYVEEIKLYEKFRLDEPWDSPHNKALIPLMPKVYRAPGSNAEPGMTTYLGIVGKDTVMRPASRPKSLGELKFDQITDGLSNTVAIVEANDDAAVIWTKPDDFDANTENPFQRLVGLREGGFLVGFVDGSVKFLPETLPIKTLKALFTKSGGEIVNLDQAP